MDSRKNKIALVMQCYISTKADIFFSQNGNSQTRRRLAGYCMKDAILPIRLLDKLMCVINYMEMARFVQIKLNKIITIHGGS